MSFYARMSYTWHFIIFYSSYKSRIKKNICLEQNIKAVYSYFTKKHKLSTFSKRLKQPHDFQVYVDLNINKLQHWTFKMYYPYSKEVLKTEIGLQGRTKNITYGHFTVISFTTSFL